MKIPITIKLFLNILGVLETIDATIYSINVLKIHIRIPSVIPSE